MAGGWLRWLLNPRLGVALLWALLVVLTAAVINLVGFASSATSKDGAAGCEDTPRTS
jgi:hypothetical protein